MKICTHVFYELKEEGSVKYVLGDLSKLKLAHYTTRKDFCSIFSVKEQIEYTEYRNNICKAFGLDKVTDVTANMFLDKLENLRQKYFKLLESSLGQAGYDEFSMERRETAKLKTVYSFTYFLFHPTFQ